jgi:uncharacterized membrane protein YiaA
LDAAREHKAEERAASEAARIDATFRNGSVTVVGILVAFSLGFLTRWAANPLPWRYADALAVVPMVSGIAAQVMALARLLDPDSLQLAVYRRCRTVFLCGLGLVALGVAVALVLNVLEITSLVADSEQER